MRITIRSFLIVLAVFTASSHAWTDQELSQMLQFPLAERLQKLQKTGLEGRRFLSRTAFRNDLGLKMRWRAVTTMGRWDAYAFQKDIDRALVSREWFLRNSALIALQSDTRERAVEGSTRLLTDPALVVRTQAVRNLIALNAVESEAVLWREMFSERNFRSGESLWVRGHIAEALAKFTGPGKSRSFQRLLLESDPRLHRWAVLGLEKTTGVKLTDAQESIESRRQKWLSRLGVEDI